MSFPAKFGGTCIKCAGRIAPGSAVNYDGSAIRHAPRCPPKGSAPVVEATPRRDDTVTDETKIAGRATYKGKKGYLVLWMGPTKRGQAAKLAFRDGTKVFWADMAEITVEKTYSTEYQRTAFDPAPMTFGRLNRLAEKYKGMSEGERADRGKCESCGRWNGNHMDDCDMAAGGMSYRNSSGHFVLGADD